MQQGQKGKRKEQQTRCRLKENWFEVSYWGLLDGGEIVPATILAGGCAWIGSNPLPQNSVKLEGLASCFRKLDVLRLKILEKVLAF